MRLPRSGPAPTSAARLIARDADRVVVLRELGAHGPQRGFGLAHLDFRVEPRGEALVGDAHDLLALDDRGARDLALREETLQVEVRARNARREREAHRLLFRGGGLRLRQRGTQRGAVLVPEVDLEAGIEREARVGLPTSAKRRREDVVLGIALVGRGAVRARPAAAARRARLRLRHSRVRCALSRLRSSGCPPALRRSSASSCGSR